MKLFARTSSLNYLLVVALSCLSPVASLQCEEPQEATAPKASSLLSLNEVIESTLAHHPYLKGQLQERNAADADLLSAEGSFDPSIKGEGLNYMTGGYSGVQGGAYVDQPLKFYGSRVFAGYRQSGGTFPIYENQYETNSEGEIQAGLEVPLVRDGEIDRRRTNIGKAVAGQTLADSAIELMKVELSQGAALAYWDWVAARNKAVVYKELLDVANERDQQIVERVARGDLPDFDRIDNQRAVLQRQAQLLSAERYVKQTEFKLSLFLRDEESQPRTILPYKAPEKIPNPTRRFSPVIDSYVQEAFESRPEFIGIRAQRQQNEQEIALARNQIQPRLDLRLLAARDYGVGSSDRDEAELKGGLKFEIPLRTRTQEGRLDFYEAKQQKLQFTENFLKDKIQADVQDAINALEVAGERVKLTQQELKAARDLAKGEVTRFKFGDSNLIFVNLREQNAADAAVREIDALQEYQKALATFEAILARIHK